MSRCTEWREERHQKCNETEDQGYRDCCDWVPCSWACRAWTWITRIVCVGWTWVTTAVCVTWDFITTVVNVVVVALESTIGWVLDYAALLVSVIFLIPYVGRFLQELWNAILFLYYSFISIVDAIMWLIGIRPEKKLRLGIIYFKIKGTPIGNVADFILSIQNAIDVYKDQANVRIIQTKPFIFSTGFGDNETANNDWINFVEVPPSPNVLDLGCEEDQQAWGEDFTLIGRYFQQTAALTFIYGDFRSLIGYGAPVIAFVIRDIKNKSGCSLGPLADYVTVVASKSQSLKHEIGHACNEPHCCDSSNMMNGNTYPPGNDLKWWQIVFLRASKHVTYF